jgi:hypothetical protein
MSFLSDGEADGCVQSEGNAPEEVPQDGELVLGLEVRAAFKTKTKMFSGCESVFEMEP